MSALSRLRICLTRSLSRQHAGPTCQCCANWSEARAAMHDNPEMASQLVERETSGPREIGSGCSPTPVSGHRRSTAFGSMPSSVGSSDPARGLEEPSPASFHDSSLHPVHDLRGSPADTWRRPSEADHVELMHMFDAERRESVGLFARSRSARGLLCC